MIIHHYFYRRFLLYTCTLIKDMENYVVFDMQKLKFCNPG